MIENGDVEPPYLLKRCLWGGVGIAALLVGVSYLPLPDMATVLRAMAGVALLGGAFMAYCTDTW